MISKDFFHGKRITVFGLGLNSGGVGTVDFLAKHGAKEIIVTDIKTREELAPSLEKLKGYKNITLIIGQHRPEDFSHVDMVIKNPLIPWTNEYVKIAEQAHVPVEMDASLFFQLIPSGVKVIGVTGSKGKTTTATLLAHILEKAGEKVVRVGIGQEAVLGKLDQVTLGQSVVFELSSWRLSSLHRIQKSPEIAVVTNIYPDHLNYYRTMEAYIHDKEAIFAYQKQTGKVIFNARNTETVAMAERAPGAKYFFSGTEDTLAQATLQADELSFRFPDQLDQQISLTGTKLFGQHNQENILAAGLAARIFGIAPETIEKGILSFPGVPHRFEFIREVGGVKYINDTAATIPEATVASLRAIDTPVILLAGGSDKQLPLDTLIEAIVTRAKHTILFQGDATKKILAQLKTRNLNEEPLIVDSMQKAVLAASRMAGVGDTVLLSPGCASFGMFQNEFDRGEQFRASVLALS